MLTPEELLESKNLTLYDLNSDDKQARAVKILWEGLSQIVSSVKELQEKGVEVQLAEPSKIDSLFV